MALGDVAAALPWPVFACGADKAPIVATGYKAATTDRLAILEQFSRPAAAMIGVPTGTVSGLCVIDVDIKNGQQGKAWLDENADALPPTRTHKTRSGGLHLLSRMPEGIDIRNSASRVAPGVDVRGNGGYVIVPPSPGYAVADDSEPAEMPRWLVRACTREDAPPAPAQRPQDRHERYTQAAIDGEVLAVMRAAEGTRNDTLHRASVKLGTLVAAGQMARATAEAELLRAGQMAGLDPRECQATIKSGLEFGLQHPREMPEARARQPHDEPPPPEIDDPGWWASLERDFEENHSVAEPAEVPTELQEPEPPDLREGTIIDPREWTAPAPLREWLVQDWIPIGGVTGLYADGGVGKSLLMQQLLTCCATATPWLGMDVRPGFAFGMFCEDDRDELHRRQEAINRACGVSMCHLELLRYSSRVGFDNLLMTFSDRNQGELTKLFSSLVQFLTQHQPRLVVIDTIADTFGGDEVKRAHARQFVQGVGGNIARAFGCAVVMIGHVSMAGMASGGGTSGSTAWNNTFRSRMYLTKPKDADGNEDADKRLLSRKKANYAPTNADLQLVWQDGCFGLAEQQRAAFDGLGWPEIDQIFDEIERAWAAKEPWSAEPQTRRFGRYLPMWMQMTYGISEQKAGRLIGQWQASRYLQTGVCDARSKTRGLRVIRRLVPNQ